MDRGRNFSATRRLRFENTLKYRIILTMSVTRKASRQGDYKGDYK